MVEVVNHMRSKFILITFCLTGLAAEPAKPLGPAVDVTLDSGESLHGQLLTFDKGQLSVKTDSGVKTRDGANVLTVKFIGPPKPLPTAQETALTEAEKQRIMSFRFGPRITARRTVEDELDFKRVQDKLDVHIDALNYEIKSAKKEEEAIADTLDLARSYLLQGRTPQMMHTLTRTAVDSIQNESIRLAVMRKTPPLIGDIVERLFPKKDKK